MNFLADTPPGNWPDAPAGAKFFSLDRLRHRCENRECPERGRVWPRWRARPEELAFEGRIYCGPACAEGAFARGIERHLLRTRREPERPHRMPLGLLLVSRGLITSAQLQEALLLQQERPGARLGNLLLERAALNETALTAALGVQWGCPVFPLEASPAYLDCARLVPLALLRPAGVLPAHYSSATRVLHLAFTQRVDHTLLYAVEQMCAVRAVPCVAADRAVSEALRRLQALPAEESVFDSVRGAHEMARMAAGYAARLRAARVQASGAADQVWFRFENPRGAHDLLFHAPSPSPPPSRSPR